MTHDATRHDLGETQTERQVVAVLVRDGQDNGRVVAHLPGVQRADWGACMVSLRALFPSPRYDIQARRHYEAGAR